MNKENEQLICNILILIGILLSKQEDDIPLFKLLNSAFNFTKEHCNITFSYCCNGCSRVKAAPCSQSASNVNTIIFTPKMHAVDPFIIIDHVAFRSREIINLVASVNKSNYQSKVFVCL